MNVRHWQINGEYASFNFQEWTDLGHVLCNCGQSSPICQIQIELARVQSDMLHIDYHQPKWIFIYLLTFIAYAHQKHGVFCFSGFWSVQKSCQSYLFNFFLAQQQGVWIFCLFVYLALNYCMLHKLMLIVLCWKTPIHKFTLFVDGAQQSCFTSH